MAGKRTTNIQPGKSVLIYIPKKIEKEIINWLNSQEQLSPSIIELIRKDIENSKKMHETISLDEESIMKIVDELENRLTGEVKLQKKKENKVPKKLTSVEMDLFKMDAPDFP